MVWTEAVLNLLFLNLIYFVFFSIAAYLTKFIHKIIFKGTNSKFQKYEIQETRPPEQPRGKKMKKLKWMGCSERLKKK